MRKGVLQSIISLSSYLSLKGGYNRLHPKASSAILRTSGFFEE